MEKLVHLKVTFKGGGYVVVNNQVDLKAQSASPDLESISPASPDEIKDFNAHQNFMKLGQKYVDLIEHWVEGRPPVTERFRYDSNDILNLMSFLMKNKEPAKKKTNHKKGLKVLEGGKDAH